MKTVNDLWIEYLIGYFERKDILRESDFNRYEKLAKRFYEKIILNGIKKRNI